MKTVGTQPLCHRIWQLWGALKVWGLTWISAYSAPLRANAAGTALVHDGNPPSVLGVWALALQLHQLARPVAPPTQAAERGAWNTPLPMPQPQRVCRGYLPGGSSRQCSSSATCHSTSMVSRYSRASSDKGIRSTGCNRGSPATIPRKYWSISRAADFI